MNIRTNPLDGPIWAVVMAGRGSTPPADLGDSALVREVLRNGDDDCFELLVQRYRDPVFKLVTSILGPEALAESEDLTQEVFILAYRKLYTFRHDGTFSAWIFRIARNKAFSYFRSARLNYRHVSSDVLQTMPCTQPFADPETLALSRDRHSIVLRHVQDLLDPQRTVVHLFYWYGCSLAEIADLLDMRVQTVKSHLYRARQRLAIRMAASEKEL